MAVVDVVNVDGVDLVSDGQVSHVLNFLVQANVYDDVELVNVDLVVVVSVDNEGHVDHECRVLDILEQAKV